MTKEELLALFYIIGNVVCLFVLLLLFIKNRKNKQTQSQYFNYIVISLAVYLIGDALWSPCYFKLIPNYDILIKFARMLYYTATAFLGYFWFVYINITIGSDLVYNNKKRRLLYIPIAIASIYAILICLFLDPSIKNIYGYLTAFSLCLEPFLFVIFAGVKVFLKQLKVTDKVLKKRYINIAFWPIVILMVSIIQLFVAELPVFCFGTTIIVLALYIYNQDSLIFTDPLTGVGNRNSLKKYVDDISKEHIYYILMADIDSFKKINDTYGHIEGDRALRFTARILRTSTIHNSYYVARYGGDEFMIIARTENENDIISTIDLINTKMKESKNELNYEITTSIGYSVLNKGESIEAAVERADNMLYEKKKIVHK